MRGFCQEALTKRSRSSIIETSKKNDHNSPRTLISFSNLCRPTRTPNTPTSSPRDNSVPQSLHPTPPPPPLYPPQTRLLSLIPHNTQPLDVLPIPTLALPPCLPHQTDNRLFLAPALLHGYVRQVGRVVALSVMGEGDTDAVGAEGPVKGVRGWDEVCEKGDGGGEAGEFGEGDGGEAVVVECTGTGVRSVGSSNRCSNSRKNEDIGHLRSQRISPQPSPQFLRFKRADASSKTLVPTSWRYRVPRHEQRMLFFLGGSGR